MEKEGLIRENAEGDSRASPQMSLPVACVFALFALVELVFLLKIAEATVFGHGQSNLLKHINFILTGCAFQLCFIAAAMKYWTCIGGRSLIVRRGRETYESRASSLSAMTTMLLLSILMLSAFAEACERALS